MQFHEDETFGEKMIEEGLEVPELPTFDVELESDSDSSSTATDRKYFVC